MSANGKPGNPMSFVLIKAGKIGASMVLMLIIFEIIGGVVSFLFDLVNALSPVISYVLWFVLGILCGIIGYNIAVSVASPDSEAPGGDARQTGFLVVMTASAVLVILSIASYLFDLKYDLTFFLAVLVSVVIAHGALLPAAP